jgi:hypothetical protein
MQTACAQVQQLGLLVSSPQVATMPQQSELSLVSFADGATDDVEKTCVEMAVEEIGIHGSGPSYGDDRNSNGPANFGG